MGAAFWVQSIRVYCIVSYADRDMQRENTAEKRDEWNCQFRGCGSCYDYLNGWLLVKEFHLKNNVGRKRIWAKEHKYLQITLWRKNGSYNFFFFSFLFHLRVISGIIPCNCKWNILLVHSQCSFQGGRSVVYQSCGYSSSFVSGLCSYCHNNRIILLVCW